MFILPSPPLKMLAKISCKFIPRWVIKRLRDSIFRRFSKCSVRSPRALLKSLRAPQAIRLLIKILTLLFLQLFKEAITALTKFGTTLLAVLKPQNFAWDTQP